MTTQINLPGLDPFRYISGYDRNYTGTIARVTMYTCFGCGQAHSLSGGEGIEIASGFSNLYDGCSNSPCPAPCVWPTAACGRTEEVISDVGMLIGGSVSIYIGNGPKNPQHTGLIIDITGEGFYVPRMEFPGFGSENFFYLTIAKKTEGWDLSAFGAGSVFVPRPR